MRTKRLFLIGAPKCGTTSLADWLGRHRQIRVVHNKEPGFFRGGPRKWILNAHYPDQFEIRDENDYMSNREEYERLFGDVPPDAWRLDASTDYFGDPKSCERIKAELDMDTVRIICILRDPVDRMFSEYRHTLRDTLEVLDFKAALDAESHRMNKGYQPLFFHAERSRYWKHVSRWNSVFGENNILLLSYGELSESTFLEKKICEFLKIPLEDLGEILTLNASGKAQAMSPRASIKKSVKRILTMASMRQGTNRPVSYPAFTEEDRHYAFSYIEEDVRRCLASPDIPSADWTTCQRLSSHTKQQSS